MPFWAWGDYHNSFLGFWAPYAFWEADFHKIKGRETLIRSHNDLKTTDECTGQTESFSASIKLCNAHMGIKFFFEISIYLSMYVCIFVIVLGQNCM
jgi:hypothetical protein